MLTKTKTSQTIKWLTLEHDYSLEMQCDSKWVHKLTVKNLK